MFFAAALVGVNAVWSPVVKDEKLKISHPAFLYYDDAAKEVLVSSFGADYGVFTVQSKVFSFPAGAYATLSTAPIRTVVDDKKLMWPNLISFHDGTLIIPDGFLPPGKTNGNIYSYVDGSLHRLTPALADTFYHKADFVDLNQDGVKDILTAHVTVTGTFKKEFRGQLVWLEAPQGGSLTEEWTQHVIVEGPDVLFTRVEMTLDGATVHAVFCSEFFARRLTVHVVSERGELLTTRVIDDDVPGRPFMVSVEDLLGNGEKQLLVTNHESNATAARIVAYEIPSDVVHGKYQKHVLASGFKTKFSITPGAASPGFAYAFTPRVNGSGPKHILLEGDGSHQVYLLSPVAPFNYQLSVVEDIGGTVGDLLLEDFDGDGIVDVLVANNDKSEISSFTFAEQSAIVV